jgi:nicotinate-nucleotide adenylyltransferase
MGEVVAVFGGSFDPPHNAHLEVVELVLARSPATRVLVVPAIRHVLGKELSDFGHRLAMCRLMCSEVESGCEVSDIERRRGLSGYTIDMIEALEEENPGTRLRLVIGSDILEQKDSWRRFDDLCRKAPLIVVARRGHETERDDLPAPAGVSSTRVRQMLGRGESPRDLVPAPVLGYIERHGLYAGG